MLKLEELEVYKAALAIGDLAWTVVDKWKFFEKDTFGKQFVRAADSIALNISEGYGRFFYAENKNFCYYSRGSAFETITCLTKIKARKLISDEDLNGLNEKMNLYFKLINPYINSIGQQSGAGKLNDSMPK